MSLEVGPADPLSAEVAALLERHLAFAHEVTPAGHVHALGAEALAGAAVTFVAAREGGRLLGVGALKPLEPGHAEIKSMHTVADARGRGVGRAVVEHLLALAATAGCGRVSLETGTGEAFAPARRLYAALGFVPCPPFASYTANPHSVCMTRAL